MKKKILSILLSVVLILIITVSSVPFVSAAVKKPNAPSSVKYYSNYDVKEHCITFNPAKGGATGYHIQIVPFGSSKGNNFYFKSTKSTKTNGNLYRSGSVYVALFSSTKISYIKEGVLYKIKVRTFNGKYKSKTKAPSNAKYSSFSVTNAAESATGIKAAKTLIVGNPNKKGIRISWNACKYATGYSLTIVSKDGKYVGKTYKTTNKSFAISKINKIDFSNAKKVSVRISPYIIQNSKILYATSEGPINKTKTIKVK